MTTLKQPSILTVNFQVYPVLWFWKLHFCCTLLKTICNFLPNRIFRVSFEDIKDKKYVISVRDTDLYELQHDWAW